MKISKKTFLILLTVVFYFQISDAQNYKAPKIDASGKITDESGKLIGSVTTEGIIFDANGNKLGYVDSEGTLIDAKSGTKLGKGEKNGSFAPHFTKTGDKGWSISTPENGTCTVKDKDGKVIGLVHENYKQFGACAIHCLTNHTDHK